MQTEIEFLKEFREDLLEVAWRDSLIREPGHPRRGRGRQALRLRVVAAFGAAVLVLAGGIGYGVQHVGDHAESLQMRARAAPSGPQKQAHKAFGSNDTGGVPYTVPSASPAPGSTNGEGTIGSPSDLARVIKNANIGLVISRDAFEDDFQRAIAVAARYGGFVQSSSTTGSRAGSLLIRVPSARFELAVGDLRRMGRVEFQTITGRDVTAQFVDLHARLEIARARRATLLVLMGKAVTIGQTLQVQNALDEVQLRIEEIQGQLRFMSRQTSYGTIRLTMREHGEERVRHREGSAGIHNPSLTRGLRHAVAGFLGVLVAVVIGLGYLVPVAVLALLVWLLVRRMRRPRTA